MYLQFFKSHFYYYTEQNYHDFVKLHVIFFINKKNKKNIAPLNTNGSQKSRAGKTLTPCT